MNLYQAAMTKRFFKRPSQNCWYRMDGDGAFIRLVKLQRDGSLTTWLDPPHEDLLADDYVLKTVPFEQWLLVDSDPISGHGDVIVAWRSEAPPDEDHSSLYRRWIHVREVE